MSQEDNKEFEMAVGTSNILESNIMDEGENFYTPIESAREPEPASETSWNVIKNDTGQLCRSCANTSDYFIPIYEGEGLEHQLEYKIQKHLPIQVSSSDTLPLQLCYQCASTLIAWDSMINSCIEADKKLRAMQEAAEEVKQSQVFEDSQAEADAETNADADAVDSDDEPLIASKTKLLSEKNIGNKEATPLKKKILSKAKNKTVTAKNEKTAQDSKEGEDKERIQTKAETELNNIFSGDLSDVSEIFDVKDSPKKSEGKKSALRKSCRTESTSSADFFVSVDEKDIESIIQEANRIRGLNIPGSNVTKGMSATPYIECPLCGMVIGKLMFSNHMLASHNLVIKKKRENVKCGMCDKMFASKSFLQRHVQSVHEKVVKARCSVCNKLFTDTSNYRQHLLIHSGVKSYICQICGKGFVQAQGLRMHMPCHSDEYPFTCSICMKRFRRKQHYEIHVIKHSGQKSHQCETCGKFFSSKNELKMHSWIHKNEWPYHCRHCGKGFNQSYGLKLHVKNHHTIAV